MRKISFMKNKAIIFDLDGTVYYGNQLIEGSMKAIYKCKLYK